MRCFEQSVKFGRNWNKLSIGEFYGSRDLGMQLFYGYLGQVKGQPLRYLAEDRPLAPEDSDSSILVI